MILEPIQARLKNITRGRWAVTVGGNFLTVTTSEPGEALPGQYKIDGILGDKVAECSYPMRPTEETRANAELIAHAPTDLRLLIDEVEKLQEDRRRLLVTINNQRNTRKNTKRSAVPRFDQS